MIKKEDMMPEESLKLLLSLSEEIFHDFKNNLSIISGLSQLSIPKVESDDVRNNLRIINEATFECRDAIDRFYETASGYHVKERKENSIRSIIFSVLDMLQYKLNTINNDKVHIETNLNISTPGSIYGNEHELKQSILNIILNGIEAMEKTGGILDINLSQIKDRIFLKIKDTGMGMSKDTLDKIFEFNFTTKGKDGTGLGLVITKNIVEEHDGEIYVKSEDGKGTTFTINLPMYEI